MSVVPDLLPIIDPDVDLQIHLDAGVLEPGSHIKPSQVIGFEDSGNYHAVYRSDS